MIIKAGLIGNPLSHSLSPRLFRIFSAQLGETFSYSLLETRKPDLGRTVERIKALGWSGFNVTLPLKEAILPFLDSLSPGAGAIGAVNSVRINKGRLEGHNTDAFAVNLSLKEAGCLPRGRACVIWGAGGAARAAAWVLASGGAAAVAILSRSVSQGAGLAKYFTRLFPRVSFTAGPLSGAPRGSTVFVNATPLGMYAPLSPELRSGGPPGAFYLDFAYNPRPIRAPAPHTRQGPSAGPTPFLADRAGTVIPGIDLLIYQALKSAELYCGRRTGAREIVELKNIIRAGLLRKRYGKNR